MMLPTSYGRLVCLWSAGLRQSSVLGLTLWSANSLGVSFVPFWSWGLLLCCWMRFWCLLDKRALCYALHPYTAHSLLNIGTVWDRWVMTIWRLRRGPSLGSSDHIKGKDNKTKKEAKTSRRISTRDHDNENQFLKPNDVKWT